MLAGNVEIDRGDENEEEDEAETSLMRPIKPFLKINGNNQTYFLLKESPDDIMIKIEQFCDRPDK